MKKKIMILMISILLIGANVYAAGDLIVNGSVAVGTSTPNGKLRVMADNEKGIRVDAGFSSAPIPTNVGAYYAVTADQADMFDKGFIGFQGLVGLYGSGTDISLIGTSNVVFLNSTTSSTVANATGTTNVFRRGSLNSADHTVTNMFGMHSFGNASAGSGNISGTNWRHAYFEALPSYGGTVATMSGLWIDKQLIGTNNYGIVLNGDESGADIVFGTGNNVRLYSRAGDLYVTDAASNETLLGPHDPETGEWIFYSKNTKTGKIVRVEMEKLVKAVEKLTGETFMVETLIEDE